MAKFMWKQVKFYNKKWNDSTLTLSHDEVERSQIVFQVLASFEKNPDILEIGCGRGALSSILTQYGHVTGVDLSKRAAELLSGNKNFRFFSGNIFDIHKKLGLFDLVLAMEVIEHVSNQEKFAEIISAHLKAGGVAILTTPNRFVARHWAKIPENRASLQPIENWLSMREFKRLLELNDLKILRKGYTRYSTFSAGPFRVINSVKLNTLLPIRKVAHLMGWGLHMYVVAEKNLQLSEVNPFDQIELIK